MRPPWFPRGTPTGSSQPVGWWVTRGRGLATALGLLLATTLLLAAPAAGEISLDASASGSSGVLALSGSLTHETPSTDDRLLVVTAAWHDGDLSAIDTVTYAGQALTCLPGVKHAGEVGTVLCYLVGPPVGSDTVEVTWTSAVTEHAIFARSLSGIDTTDPLGATTNATSSGTQVNASLTTQAPDSVIVAGAASTDETVSYTPSGSTVEDAAEAAGALGLGISGAAGHVNTTSTGSYEVAWTLSDSENWLLILAEFKAVPIELGYDAPSSSVDESTTPAQISVSLTEASGATVTVDYAVTGGNATGGGTDYTLADGTLTFNPGETTRTIDVTIDDDTLDEPNETVDVTLSNPAGGVLASTTVHTLALVDDDPNNAPSADAASPSVDEDDSLTTTLTGSDVDPGDTITFSLDTLPTNGTASLDEATGELTYTPETNFSGSDELTFTVSDNHGALSGVATVSITVNAVNDVPVGSADSASVDEDNAKWIDVLTDDTDVDEDVLSIASATDPANGTVTVHGNDTLTYTPDGDFSGTDTFDYTLSDGSLTDTATVTITVNAVNDAPVGNDDAVTVEEDQVEWIDVLDDDTDVEGDTLSLASATDPANGTVAIHGNDTLTYTPDADWSGTDTFDYTLSDGSLTDTATVTVTVNAVNDAPVGSDDEASVAAGGSTWIDVLGDDTDVDGDALSIASATDPANGTVTVHGNGTLTYTPDAKWAGTDTFTYTVSDGNLTDTVTVNVTVAAGAVASIEITPGAHVLIKDAILDHDATASDASGVLLSEAAITWAISDTSVATVNETTGELTAVDDGTATLTASSTNGVNETRTIRVVDRARDIEGLTLSLSPSNATLTAGETTTLALNATNATGTPVEGLTPTWSVSNSSVAEVDADGVVRGYAAGETNVTATVRDVEASAVVTVTAGGLARIQLSPATAVVAPGGTVQLEATGEDAYHNPVTLGEVTYAASPSARGSVDSDGLVTATSATGLLNVTATSGGVTATAHIHALGSDAPVTFSTLEFTDGSETALAFIGAAPSVDAGDTWTYAPNHSSEDPCFLRSAVATFEDDAGNLTLELTFTPGLLNTSPREIDMGELRALMAGLETATAPGVYLQVQATEDGKAVSSARLNELLDEVELTICVPDEYFENDGLDHREVRWVEFSDGTLVDERVKARSISDEAHDGYRNFTTTLDAFSAFAFVAEEPRKRGGGGGGGGGFNPPSTDEGTADGTSDEANPEPPQDHRDGDEAAVPDQIETTLDDGETGRSSRGNGETADGAGEEPDDEQSSTRGLDPVRSVSEGMIVLAGTVVALASVFISPWLITSRWR